MATVEGEIVGYIVVERGHAGAPGHVDGTEWAAREDAESEVGVYQRHADGKGTGARYSVGAIVELTVAVALVESCPECGGTKGAKVIPGCTWPGPALERPGGEG